MMKPYIKDGKCAISSPMHTSVCIELLRAPSRHNKCRVTTNNVEMDRFNCQNCVQLVLIVTFVNCKIVRYIDGERDNSLQIATS